MWYFATGVHSENKNLIKLKENFKRYKHIIQPFGFWETKTKF